MVSNVVIRPLQKANCGDKGLFELHILIKVHRKMPRLRTQGRNLKVELETEVMEESYLLACASSLT